MEHVRWNITFQHFPSEHSLTISSSSNWEQNILKITLKFLSLQINSVMLFFSLLDTNEVKLISGINVIVKVVCHYLSFVCALLILYFTNDSFKFWIHPWCSPKPSSQWLLLTGRNHSEFLDFYIPTFAGPCCLLGSSQITIFFLLSSYHNEKKVKTTCLLWKCFLHDRTQISETCFISIFSIKSTP